METILPEITPFDIWPFQEDTSIEFGSDDAAVPKVHWRLVVRGEPSQWARFGQPLQFRGYCLERMYIRPRNLNTGKPVESARIN